MSDEGRDVFVQSRNELAKALRDCGADPLITGAMLVYFEQLGFFILGLQSEVRRLQRVVTRQNTRQTGGGRQRPTKEKAQVIRTLNP